ncbi:unnamed protein product [Cladocopium goreaui]|uniref:Protein unc-45 homolog B n=1 Tax=Cladocopium goreaui TaxID=2562237 RepID=A0A9P1CUR7_9DINO|nr:unnamed protein product [Cladocopium goreaui]
MAPVDAALALSGEKGSREIEEWSNEVEEVTSQIRGIIDGTITDFEDFDQKLALKDRAKQIRQEEQQARRQKVLLYGSEGKGEGTKYKWWCKRCFVEYFIDLPEGKCSRCQQSDQMMSQEARRAELMEKLDVFKEEKAKHKWRKDKWNRWKKSQALLGKSRFINYKAWEYWEPDTDSEEEGDPIVPRDNPEFLAMEADLKDRKKKQFDKAKTAEKCRQRGNQCMTEGDYVGAIEHYDEGLEYRRDSKALWTNKALAELKVFRWHDAIASCNKVIEYSEIFEDGFKKSEDANFKAFTRRAQALRGLHRWEDALNDLEDALSIYPRNKEALDLMEKTKQACEDARKARGVEAAVAEAVVAVSDGDDGEGVRVEIEESDEETMEATPATAVEPSGEPLHSLERLNKKEFSQLLKDLDNATLRSAFCARSTAGTAGTASAKADQWVGRKIDLKVDEVVQPSRLDSLLQHMERCCVLWRKRRTGQGVQAMQDDEPEAKDADDFVELVTPRALSVLLALAKQNDHHCSLTVPAVRHVWPLLEGSQQWRYDILSLLFEWSQRSISAKAMAEFAARYPQHLQMLIDIVAKEKKEDALPPGFQDNAKKAADFLELGSEAAMQQMMDSLLVQSPMELAIGSVGNLCAAGAPLNIFQEQISGLVPSMVSALRRHLRPNDWRVCGPAAGALCNLLRLPSAAAEVESCSELLLKALSEETKPEIAAMKELKAQLPSRLVASATSRLLGVLVNLVVCRPTSLAQLQHHGALEIVLPLLDPEAYSSQGSDGSDEPQVISTRVCLLSGRLIGAFPDLKLDQEIQLLQKLQQILQTISEFISKVAGKTSIDEKILEFFDPPVRLLVTLLTKTGALTRLARRSEENSPSRSPSPPSSLSSVVLHLSQLLKALLPAQHLAKEEEGASASRLRGNLALLFGQLSDMQAANEDAAVWKALDLGDVVETFLEMFRRERGAAQHNLGVCITKFCSNGRYRERVKEGNGLESLHQIQLPKVNDQKEKEQRMHRLETSVTDRRREILRRR